MRRLLSTAQRDCSQFRVRRKFRMCAVCMKWEVVRKRSRRALRNVTNRRDQWKFGIACWSVIVRETFKLKPAASFWLPQGESHRSAIGNRGRKLRSAIITEYKHLDPDQDKHQRSERHRDDLAAGPAVDGAMLGSSLPHCKGDRVRSAAEGRSVSTGCDAACRR